MIRYFITVDWCNKGRRGVFCNNEGKTNPKDTPHTELEMHEALGPFWLILNPKSEPFTEEEMAEYKYWRPLAEYSNVWGIVRKDECS